MVLPWALSGALELEPRDHRVDDWEEAARHRGGVPRHAITSCCIRPTCRNVPRRKLEHAGARPFATRGEREINLARQMSRVP